MVLTIGFNRAGSSLVGYLLNAHPNIVVAHEPKARKSLYLLEDIRMLLYGILLGDNDIYKKVMRRRKLETDGINPASQEPRMRVKLGATRYPHIPNQWQYHCKRLEVAGIKASYMTSLIFSRGNILEKFTDIIKKQKMSLKFIFTVRNPYDIITTATIERIKKHMMHTEENKKILLDVIKLSEIRAAYNKELLSRIKAQNVFISRHEDTVADPKDQLTKLCHFLKVEVNEDYLNDCMSVVWKTARQSRHEIDWSEEHKKRVAKLIEDHDFFSGYSWSS